MADLKCDSKMDEGLTICGGAVFTQTVGLDVRIVWCMGCGNVSALYGHIGGGV